MFLQQAHIAMIGDCPVEIFQYDSELEQLLEIGSLYGGTLWFWMQNSEPGAVIVSIDLVVPTVDHRYEDIVRCQALWRSWTEAAQVKLVTLHANSSEPATVRQAAGY